MGKILTHIYELVVGQEIIALVNDIKNNPSYYKIDNISSPVRVYRDNAFILWAFDSGDIKLLGITYTGFRARLVHRALCYAILNGCEVE